MAATGSEPSEPTSIPDSAYTPVSLRSPVETALLRLSTEDIPVVRDSALLMSPVAPLLGAAPSVPVERAQPALPTTKTIVVSVAPKTTHSISGAASWYCRAGISPCTVNHPDDGGVDRYAAAGPRLRAAIGSDWRGKIVYVDGIRVKLIDWCQCYKGEPNEKLLDLYYDVFARTGSSVRIRW